MIGSSKLLGALPSGDSFLYTTSTGTFKVGTNVKIFAIGDGGKGGSDDDGRGNGGSGAGYVQFVELSAPGAELTVSHVNGGYTVTDQDGSVLVSVDKGGAGQNGYNPDGGPGSSGGGGGRNSQPGGDGGSNGSDGYNAGGIGNGSGGAGYGYGDTLTNISAKFKRVEITPGDGGAGGQDSTGYGGGGGGGGGIILNGKNGYTKADLGIGGQPNGQKGDDYNSNAGGHGGRGWGGGGGGGAGYTNRTNGSGNGATGCVIIEG